MPTSSKRRMSVEPVVVALLCAAVAVFGGLLVLTRAGSEPQQRERAPVVYSSSPSSIDERVARPQRRHSSPGSQRAARRFATDFAATLTGALAARDVRHATAGLRARIASAGLRAPGRGRVTHVELRLRPITRTLVAASGRARVGAFIAHLSFLIANRDGRWLVDDLGDPADPTALASP